MKKILLILLLVLSFGMFSCENEGTSPSINNDLANTILASVNAMIRQLKVNTLLIQSQAYQDYHAPELPAGMYPPRYGFDPYDK